MGYIVACVGAFLLVEKIIYPIPSVGYSDDSSIIKLTTSNQNVISARYWETPDSSFVVLYSHGNGEDLFSSREPIEAIQVVGFSVFAYDYSGYGTSQGQPSVEQTFLDIEAAFQYLVTQKNIPPQKIIVYGRSIGGGPSVHLASQHPIAGLILESTFASIYRTQLPFVILPFDKYPSLITIAQVKAPVLIVHGDRDITVRYWNAKLLYAAAGEPKRLVTIEKAGHSNLLRVAGERYAQVLRDFRAEIEKQQSPSN